MNRATMVGFGRDVPEELDRFATFLAERGENPKIEITNFATEPFLASLAKRHFVIKEFENVLLRRLHKGEDPFASMSRPPAEGLKIIRVDPNDDAMCCEHAILVMKGFMPEPIPEEHIAIWIRSIVHPRGAGFLALIDGEPAGACGMELFEHGGMRSAALWGAVVAEPFRRRGLQQAMLAHRMAFGLERGCDVSTIESEQGVARLAQARQEIEPLARARGHRRRFQYARPLACFHSANNAAHSLRITSAWTRTLLLPSR
ncbi:MAG: GNAT family N-acetyltransferase [Planctomycetota bacterium]|nr:GNAT family N-acetyltransferase [Planctomycetota bacterium]